MKLTALLLFITANVFAQTPPIQGVNVPMESQKAMVMQRIGMSDVTVDYSRPAVKGRKVWGDLVPYNEGAPYPWRAGANENTVITFSDDVLIEGQPLRAGRYGLHMIPAKDAWTVMFSTNTTSWGSFSYRKSEDALRVKVMPREGAMEEYLRYGFENLSDSSADLCLSWEKLTVPVKIQFDTKKIMSAYIENAMRSPVSFSWQGLKSGADYLLLKNYDLDKALGYIQRSVNADENYFNLKTKADILNKMGRTQSADSVLNRAIEVGSYNDLYRAGTIAYNRKEFSLAKQLLERAYAKYPHTPQVAYYLGLVNGATGDKSKAKQYFTEALTLNPSANFKKNIDAELKKLE